MSKATIKPTPNGPFEVKGLEKLTRSDGTLYDASDAHYLCRCGGSANKPFCDGSHKKLGFSGERERTGAPEARSFEGKALTVVDDVGVCSHAGECVRGAPDVFFTWEGDQRISHPDAAPKDKVIETVRKCPSGSLSYAIDGRRYDEYFSEEEIFVSKDAPLQVRGGVVLDDPASDQLASREHYTLCRCGASKNKPLCDGAHKKTGFKAD